MCIRDRHYTVDDHAIVQHLPDYETAYHAGDGKDGPGNATSIGIEICVNAGGDFAQAQANAASLVRQLMEEHGIPIDRVVQHAHWNGKDCPKTCLLYTSSSGRFRPSTPRSRSWVIWRSWTLIPSCTTWSSGATPSWTPTVWRTMTR